MNDEEKVVDFDDLPEEAQEELSNGLEEGVDLVCPIQAQLHTANELRSTGMDASAIRSVRLHHITWPLL